MFIINEREGKLTNFLAPSMTVALGAILLNFIQSIITIFLIFLNFNLEVDILIFSLLITFLSQVGGILIVYFLMIPLMKVKDVQKQSWTSRNLVRTLLLICSTFAVSILSNYLFIFIFDLFNLIPQSGYSGILLNSSFLNKDTKQPVTHSFLLPFSSIISSMVSIASC